MCLGAGPSQLTRFILSTVAVGGGGENGGATAEVGGGANTYKEELVEFLSHGLADMLLHQWEQLHKVLRQKVGSVARQCGDQLP